MIHALIFFFTRVLDRLIKMTPGKIRYAVFESLSCNFAGMRGEERRLGGGGCRRELNDIEWTGVGRQADRQAGRQAGMQG